MEVQVTTTQDTTQTDPNSAVLGTMIVTDAAASKIAELIAQEEEPDMFLRVTASPSGCSGLSYEMFFDSEKADDDVLSSQGEIIVAADSASAPHLTGATLDYKDGLEGAGFAINNPNVTKSCGCGNS